MTVSIRPLQPSDDRVSFTCGNDELDRFFRKHAADSQFLLHVGATYVATGGKLILAFATVAGGSLMADALPDAAARRLPKYPLPVLRLARLGVAIHAQGTGLGTQMMGYVFRLALEMGGRLGCVGVVVDSKPTSVTFHEGFGFTRLDVVEGAMRTPKAPTPMFLSIALVKAAMGP